MLDPLKRQDIYRSSLRSGFTSKLVYNLKLQNNEACVFVVDGSI